MTTEKPIDEILREREHHPFGLPRPYNPDHPNLLASGLAGCPIENVPLWSGLAKTLLIALAVLAALYGAYGVVTDDLFLPGKRSPGKHFHGVAAWLIFCMILCVSSFLYNVAVSEYDAMNRKITKKEASFFFHNWFHRFHGRWSRYSLNDRVGIVTSPSL